MTPVDQTIVDKGRGDCMRAAIATLFDLEIIQVPHFTIFTQARWVDVFYHYLRGIGWEYNGCLGQPKLEELDGKYSVNGYYYASVPSRTYNDGTSHAVIIDCHGIVVHDPNPNKLWQGEYVIGIADYIYLLEPSEKKAATVSHIQAKGTKPTVHNMVQHLKENNLDYHEFESHNGTCDSCGKEQEVREVFNSAGNTTLYGYVCDDCLDEAHHKATDHVTPAPSVEQEDKNMGKTVTAGKYPNSKITYADLTKEIYHSPETPGVRRYHVSNARGEWGFRTKAGVIKAFESQLKDGGYTNAHLLISKTEDNHYFGDVEFDNPGYTAPSAPASEHPAKTAVKEWNKAELAAGDYWMDATPDERETPKFKKEYSALIKQRDKALEAVRKHANKMTDAEWNTATEGTDSDREDFATEPEHQSQ